MIVTAATPVAADDRIICLRAIANAERLLVRRTSAPPEGLHALIEPLHRGLCRQRPAQRGQQTVPALICGSHGDEPKMKVIRFNQRRKSAKPMIFWNLYRLSCLQTACIASPTECDSIYTV